MANNLAYLVLISWPVLCFLLLRRREPAQALIIASLGGYLLLPNITIGLQGLPDYGKSLAILFGALASVKLGLKFSPSLIPQSKLMRVLLLGALLSPCFTVLTNMSASGPQGLVVPPMAIWDIVSQLFVALTLVLTFLLGYCFLGTNQGHDTLIKMLAIAGLAYSVLAIIELFIAPVLHRNIYGFFQHDWRQHVRGDGYRPIVFLPHALDLAMFLVCSLIATVSGAVPRGGIFGFSFPSLRAVHLFGVLFFAKSVGPILLGFFAMGLSLWRSKNLPAAFILVTAILVAAYPAIRTTNIIPLAEIVSIAESYSPDRAESLSFRIKNEDIVLQRLRGHELFGWGSVQRIVDHNRFTGRMDIIFDGEWIITLAHQGWLGYLSNFGLLIIPLLSIVRLNRRGYDVSRSTMGIGLILAIILINLIPNSFLPQFVWLAGGSLLGYLEYGRQEGEANQT